LTAASTARSNRPQPSARNSMPDFSFLGPFAMTPREHQQAFLETLASAITQWQAVEIELFFIFSKLLRAENNSVASAAFHSVINFNTRLAMTHAAAQIALANNPALGAWNGLHGRCAKRAKRRNNLVHFMLLHDATRADGSITMRLQPSIFDARAAQNKHKRTYEMKHIEAIRSSFGLLSQDLHCFARALPAPASWQPISPQSGDRQTPEPHN
jgi:hypothetical protein